MFMPQAADKGGETVVMGRVVWRLMPFLLLACLIASIDRVNVGFASLQMNKALGIAFPWPSCPIAALTAAGTVAVPVVGGGQLGTHALRQSRRRLNRRPR